jgi:protein tyrosine/serine phosphatase
MDAGAVDRMNFGQRLTAHLRAHALDHAFLRLTWTNLHEIAPGVWRSNQPSPARIRRYVDMGIRAIINLRGDKPAPSYVLAKEQADQLGLPLHSIAIGARGLVSAERYLELLDLFETVERPFVLHCKSGADRAGIASAFWLIHMEGQSVQQARAMLSPRFLHLKQTKTGILDQVLDAYESHVALDPMSLRDWLRDHYDTDTITADFRRGRGKNG